VIVADVFYDGGLSRVHAHIVEEEGLIFAYPQNKSEGKWTRESSRIVKIIITATIIVLVIIIIIIEDPSR
jgi:hypothetical protein